jgi:head-tail adaptor
MRAGELDSQIVIEASTETRNAIGEPIKTWVTFAGPLWARKRPLGGSEGPAGGQEQFATARYEWLVRFLPGVLPKMRADESGIYHDIDLVDETGRRRGELRLVTTQRAV